MTRTLHARFDGAVFRPDQPLDLKPNTRYRMTIEDEDDATPEEVYPLTRILQMATDMGVTDLSVRHQAYAHGEMEGGSRGG